MGGCSSCDSSAAAAGVAQVVMLDGTLREFQGPATAAHVLGKDGRTCFVCDADEMDFDGFLSAVAADELLRPGQLYFVLPRSMLKHRLHGEGMAILAAKASVAIAGSRGERKCRRRRRPAKPLAFDEGSRVEIRMVMSESSLNSKQSGGARRKYIATLSMIPE